MDSSQELATPAKEKAGVLKFQGDSPVIAAMPRPNDVPITVDESGNESHPSWGSIVIHRCSGNTMLFDSVSRHQHFISLSIHRATRKRDLNQDWIHRELRDVVEVNMTESQFARMLSSAGMGEGVPCTISRLEGQLIPSAPEDKIGETYKREIEESTEEATAALRAVEARIEEMLAGKTVKKSDLKKLSSEVRRACMNIDDHLPFLIGQVEEKLETVVNEAKTNIDSFLQYRAQQLGVSQMLSEGDKTVSQLLEYKEEDGKTE